MVTTTVFDSGCKRHIRQKTIFKSVQVWCDFFDPSRLTVLDFVDKIDLISWSYTQILYSHKLIPYGFTIEVLLPCVLHRSLFSLLRSLWKNTDGTNCKNLNFWHQPSGWYRQYVQYVHTFNVWVRCTSYPSNGWTPTLNLFRFRGRCTTLYFKLPDQRLTLIIKRFIDDGSYLMSLIKIGMWDTTGFSPNEMRWDPSSKWHTY